ncbi:hypothetical protein SUDANB15_06531 [Streptomyces sp. enrichment culture]
MNPTHSHVVDGRRGLPAAQQPEWPDQNALRRITEELAAASPLVLVEECDRLRELLGAAARGEAFVLQGGDCAETFAGSTADAVQGTLRTLLQMALVLTHGASVPVVKVGRMAYADRLDPDRTAGRLSFVVRMGRDRIRDLLPVLVEKAAGNGVRACWLTDPMHGNTFTAGGRKTRRFDDVLDEVRGFFEVHRALGSRPGGLHLELTGDDVTECLGGGRAMGVGDLRRDYASACDPRLNHSQSLDLAFLVAEMLQDAGETTGRDAAAATGRGAAQPASGGRDANLRRP